MFNSYVSLPEGKVGLFMGLIFPWDLLKMFDLPVDPTFVSKWNLLGICFAFLWMYGPSKQITSYPLVGERQKVRWDTWWLIPLSKWVITPVISGLTLLIPFITGVITHLLSGMSHQVG